LDQILRDPKHRYTLFAFGTNPILDLK